MAPTWPLRELVVITWHDSYTRGRWYELEEHRKVCGLPMECRTVGWVTKRDKETITVVQTMSGDAVSDSMTIPLSCIRRVRRVPLDA
ncbi:MAG: hypothetical protein ABL982_00015 [Vicinamibacterales bacterium]